MTPFPPTYGRRVGCDVIAVATEHERFVAARHMQQAEPRDEAVVAAPVGRRERAAAEGVERDGAEHRRALPAAAVIEGAGVAHGRGVRARCGAIPGDTPAEHGWSDTLRDFAERARQMARDVFGAHERGIGDAIEASASWSRRVRWANSKPSAAGTSAAASTMTARNTTRARASEFFHCMLSPCAAQRGKNSSATQLPSRSPPPF